MNFCLSENESQKIISHYGPDFYNMLRKELALYASKWDLDILQFVDYYSVNCIFICHSKQFGDAVLKIGRPCKEVFTEVNALREYNGSRFCRLYKSDIDNGIILIERIVPGTQLKAEKTLDKRLSVFSNLFNGLHIEPENADIYPTYADWTKNITAYMSKREDYKELYSYMKRANDICLSVCRSYTKKMLLHGDFHYENILRNRNGSYTIIDPKGVIGDPVFDVPRYILNEYENASSDQRYRKISYIFDYFEKSLNIPTIIQKQCFFVDMTMAASWNVESGNKPDMDGIIFAENILDNWE